MERLKNVHLFVGEKEFITRRDTLVSIPNTYFTKLFTNKFEVNENHIFIDRDPTHFNYILNYLRHPKTKLFPLPHDPDLLEELLIEAKFYLIPQLKKRIKQVLKETQRKKEIKLEKEKSIDTKLSQILGAIDEIYCSLRDGKFSFKILNEKK
ncbi:btb/poz domain-containing adapter for cul3-mediated rhoa degradation protein family member [Anaeramoeba flamelloides]|uniref:Btb/poz domain-containing adapter for cul3-mediated rhoa degradation protein family member n=1 Tax=Anaeramoeba flamelloides TaxID=1746091 RepID=A0AAV8A0Q5_9EUKA|nr:btb/poz domain-containing adapter for cul3-mediated rhoa degradation protein family member [Anaeramoeba flamelloides]KAJ6245529.1 btb/poz domain-containing adapter for cul3-mediated rhoa degradation protein family member [Anaeramoeba flamelloides]